MSQKSPAVEMSDWPSHGTVRFLVRSQPDANGRRDFYALWWSGDRRRGQFFHDSLEKQTEISRLDGCDVEIVEHFGSLSRAA